MPIMSSGGDDNSYTDSVLSPGYSQMLPTKNSIGQLNPDAFGSVSDLAAAVSQAQYEEWKNSFLPVAINMNNQTTYNNPGLVQKGITQAVGNVNQAFDTSLAVKNRMIQQAGITEDPMMGAVNSRVNSVQRSASVVDAANRIRQNLADRNKSILQGGVPNYQAGV